MLGWSLASTSRLKILTADQVRTTLRRGSASPHPGRTDSSPSNLTKTPRTHPLTHQRRSNLAHGRDSTSLKSAQFSFAFVPLAAGRDPSTSNPAPGRTTHPQLFSSLPQGTNPILFQSQTTQPTSTTPSPSPSPASPRHPTCPSSSPRPKPVTHPDPVRPAFPPVKVSSALYQPKPSRRPAPARQAPNLCNSDRQGALPLNSCSPRVLATAIDLDYVGSVTRPVREHSPCLKDSPASLCLCQLKTGRSALPPVRESLALDLVQPRTERRTPATRRLALKSYRLIDSPVLATDG